MRRPSSTTGKREKPDSADSRSSSSGRDADAGVDHPFQREHHVPDRTAAQFQGVVQPLLRAVVDQPGLAGVLDEPASSVSENVAETSSLRLHPQQLQQPVGEGVDREDHRPQRPGQRRPAAGRAAARVRTGSASAMFFGTISPSSMCRYVARVSAITNETACPAPVRHPHRVEHRLQQMRDGRLRDHTQHQRAQRDAELRRRHQRRHVLQPPQHAAGPPVAVRAAFHGCSI